MNRRISATLYVYLHAFIFLPFLLSHSLSLTICLFIWCTHSISSPRSLLSDGVTYLTSYDQTGFIDHDFIWLIFWGSCLSDCSTCLCAEEDKTVLLDVIQTGFQIQPSWSWLVYWTKPVVLLKVRLTRMVYAFHIDSKPVYNTNEIVLSIFTSIFFEQQGCRLANTHFRLESSKLRVVSFTYCIFALDCVTK